MTAIPAPREERLLPPPPRSTEEVGFWGMALFLITESSLFAYLIGSYFYLAVSNHEWPPAGIELPKLQLPLIMTAVLLLSSVVGYWAEKGIEQGEHGRFRIGLVIAMLLGLAFLVLQGFEYHDKLKHMHPQEHAYPSIFFTITGFHGAHVAMGVLLMAYLGIRELLGHFDERRHLAVKNVFLYWHTVDGVWLVILSSLYISPHLYR